MRQPLILGNWKMNGCTDSNRALLQELAAGWSGQAQVGVCPPAVYIAQTLELLSGTDIAVGSQDASKYQSGAYTGELAAPMLAELGCRYAIVGHSERRQYHGETDQDVADKVATVLAAKVTPVLCVGESLEQRESGQALAIIAEQLDAVLSQIGEEAFEDVVVAYEPVWAIGTGKTASPEQAQEVHQFIREKLGQAGASVQVLYGGSVKADNASELFAQADIDGALVGGASLKAEDFLAICEAANR
ncbi:triose-phosphate isomerase [Candidatus Pelagadaptatus aseana]|uniref:triose-phosphate isomerase n=1 Tax=Candidatus Pelagadaptatus aseana TaxID=3120508 RepID=UPI003C6FED09